VKKKVYFHLEKTLIGTNWTHFGEIIGITFAIEMNEGYTVKTKVLTEEDDVGLIARTAIDVLYKMNESRDIISFGGTQFGFSLLAEKSESKEYGEKATDLALEHYDLLYSMYKNLGYNISFDAILKGYGIVNSDLIDLKNIDVYFNQGKVKRIEKHLQAKIECLKNIHQKYIDGNGVSWKTKNKKDVYVNFDFKDVGDTLESAWECDTSWLGSGFKPEEEFISWMSDYI